MLVQTIECQIATVLMKRYLDGDELPQELIEDLEQHLKVCPGCKKILDNEKVSIEDVLDGPQEPKSFIDRLRNTFTKTPEPRALVTTHPNEAILAATQTINRSTPPGLAAFKNPKVLVLSAGLAVVVIAMSTILKDPTRLLGPKAGPIAAKTEEKSEDSSDHTEPTKKDPEAAADTHKEEPQADSHKPEPESEGHPTDPPKGGDSHGEETTSHDAQKPSLDTVLQPAATVKSTDTRVPDKPQQNSSIVIVGSSSTTHKDLGEKPQPTAQAKPAPKPKAPAAKPTHTPTKRKPTTKRPAVATKPKSQPKPSGIKVYDQNGKPIH